MKHACGPNCGCSNPYGDSTQAVWHDPTSYNLTRHGPPYLKLGSDARARLRQANRQSAYYDTGQQMAQNSMAPLSVLLAGLRAMYMLLQTFHWQTRGGHYYADHLLFQRLYEESTPFIDDVAERAVGLGGETLVDPCQQIELMEHMIQKICGGPGVMPPEQLVQTALAGERMLLGLNKAVLDGLEAQGALTHGTSNLLEGLHDKHEQFTYLLGQRNKTASVGSYDRR